jgi:hypothetical protein
VRPRLGIHLRAINIARALLGGREIGVETAHKAFRLRMIPRFAQHGEGEKGDPSHRLPPP